MKRARLSHLKEILDGTESESKGHQAECDREDHLRDPYRNIQQCPISHLKFVSNEFQCRISQKATNGKGEKMGDEHNDSPSQRGQPSGNDIDVDMLSFLRGKGGPDKADPQDEISQKRLPPIKTRGENITEDDLKQGDQNHEAQEGDDEGLFDVGNGLIGLFPSVRRVGNDGPLLRGGVGLTGISNGVHYFLPLR